MKGRRLIWPVLKPVGADARFAKRPVENCGNVFTAKQLLALNAGKNGMMFVQYVINNRDGLPIYRV
jgi:hypothetical protein